MNSKDLIQKLNEGSTPVGTLFADLVADGDLLVKARRAQTPEAIRSCYLEQNSKWVSACRKTKLGLDELEFMKFMEQHPRYKHNIREAPKTDYRSEALSRFTRIAQDAEKQRLSVEADIRTAAEMYLKTAQRFHDEVNRNPDISNLPDDEKFKFVERLMFVDTTRNVIRDHGKTMHSIMEITRQLVMMFAEINRIDARYPVHEREEIVALIMKQPDLLLGIAAALPV